MKRLKMAILLLLKKEGFPQRKVNSKIIVLTFVLSFAVRDSSFVSELNVFPYFLNLTGVYSC